MRAPNTAATTPGLGTQTAETRRYERLINRFDYDGDYRTVLNHFLMQAAVDHPLTVHGSGGQTRAFIHIQDTVRCIQIALENPPKPGERVQIFNPMTEARPRADWVGMVPGIDRGEGAGDAVRLQNGRSGAWRGHRPQIRPPLRPQQDSLCVAVAGEPAVGCRGAPSSIAKATQGV